MTMQQPDISPTQTTSPLEILEPIMDNILWQKFSQRNFVNFIVWICYMYLQNQFQKLNVFVNIYDI